jgi:kynureninase
VQDVAAIVKRAHEVGAYVVADLYQSAGTVPVDVAAWDVDFATGGSVKWLCGGPGAGYLYVAPRLRDRLKPRVTGWMAHAHPFAFETGPIEYAGDATRFLHGSPAIPALYAARAGQRILETIGIEAIREKSVRQVQLLMDLAAELGFRTRTPAVPEQRGGMAILDVAHGAALLHRRRGARPRGAGDASDPRFGSLQTARGGRRRWLLSHTACGHATTGAAGGTTGPVRGRVQRVENKRRFHRHALVWALQERSRPSWPIAEP